MASINEYISPKLEKMPTIYAYSDKAYPNMLKVGYTTRDVYQS